MNIVCATDDNFVQHCCIMLVSLLTNNEDVNIYVLTEGLTPKNKKVIEDEVTALHGNLQFCLVESSIVEKFPMPKIGGLSHISRATYYRLLIADLLPKDVSKAIYLDCDLIIHHSIDELWNINIDGYALAAVKQIGYGYEALRLGYPIEYGYFNAGMNVINLDYFRKYNVSRVLIDYISANYQKIKFHDQDALNGALYDKVLHLMPQWNMTSAVYIYQLGRKRDRVNGNLVCDYMKEKENAIKHQNDPMILHYVSKPKPWQKGCVHPLYHLYYKYAVKTIHFKHVKPENNFSRMCYVAKYTIKERVSALKQFIVRTDKTRY